MHSGAANPRGPGARSLAEGVGEGRLRATNRHCRGEGEEGLERGIRVRGAQWLQRGLVSEAASGLGGAGIGWPQEKTLFSRKSEPLPFWQPRPNTRLEVAASVHGKAQPGGRKRDRRLPSANDSQDCRLWSEGTLRGICPGETLLPLIYSLETHSLRLLRSWQRLEELKNQ